MNLHYEFQRGRCEVVRQSEYFDVHWHCSPSCRSIGPSIHDVQEPFRRVLIFPRFPSCLFPLFT